MCSDYSHVVRVSLFLFFGGTQSRVCAQVLSCLVQIASVRRSLFNNAERAKFLSHLVDGVKRILANPQVRGGPAASAASPSLPDGPAVFAFQCLPDPNNYHEFCRLLARLKSNYQLGELVKVENYPEVIRLIANFTVTSLQVSVGAQDNICRCA